jgi:Zn-dependent M28 family amino/carboxypeptidase
VEKSLLAEKYWVKGLLIYNDGTAPDRFQALQNVRIHSNATIPAYFLSYNLGMRLVTAASDTNANTSIIMEIDVSDAEVGNICADTSSGNRTKTIVVGSHSDGVPDGSGINDNGKKSIDILMDCIHLTIIDCFQ